MHETILMIDAGTFDLDWKVSRAAGAPQAAVLVKQFRSEKLVGPAQARA
jgi:hypothetical protein